MWSLSDQSENVSSFGKVSVDTVVYEYDGPLIFTANIGFSRLLFSKIHEEGDTDIFIASEVDDFALRSLEEGKLSVRGALGYRECFVVALSPSMKIEKLWRSKMTEIPSEFLPEFGAGLDHTVLDVVDSVDQLNSFMSVRFSGEGLTSEVLPFQKFKKLIDDTYTTARRMFSPTRLRSARSVEYDFFVREPVFGSLILSMDSPKVDMDRVRKHLKNKKITGDQIENEFISRKDDFFLNASELIKRASQEKLVKSDLNSYEDFLHDISEILPDPDTGIDRVEFRSRYGGVNNYLDVSADDVEAIRRAEELLFSDNHKVSGKIEIINAKSKTFVLDGFYGKQVTCRAGTEIFTQLDDLAEFRQGSYMNAIGRFSRRPRRDELVLSSVPEFISKP